MVQQQPPPEGQPVKSAITGEAANIIRNGLGMSIATTDPAHLEAALVKAGVPSAESVGCVRQYERCCNDAGDVVGNLDCALAFVACVKRLIVNLAE